MLINFFSHSPIEYHAFLRIGSNSHEKQNNKKRDLFLKVKKEANYIVADIYANYYVAQMQNGKR